MLYSQMLSNDIIEAKPRFRSGLSRKNQTLYMKLWIELKRQQAMLRRRMTLDDVRRTGGGLLSDVMDQASMDREQELTLIGKARLREQLRDIENALAHMEHNAYGLCIRCGEDIPFARLRVQPSAVLCVSCQALNERAGLVASGHTRRERLCLPDMD